MKNKKNNRLKKFLFALGICFLAGATVVTMSACKGKNKNSDNSINQVEY